MLDKKYGLESDETTAQKLMKILDQTKGMSYVTYTGTVFHVLTDVHAIMVHPNILVRINRMFNNSNSGSPRKK